MMLKTIRVTLAVVIFTLITFYFLDFANILPFEIHALLHLQFDHFLFSGFCQYSAF